MFDRSDIISGYSREEAIADGVLVDVSKDAREAGITYPTALTRLAYETYVAWKPDDERPGVLQNEAGRLWDVVWMFRMAARRSSGSTLHYQLYVVPRDGSSNDAQLVTLKAIVGPGDTAEPVVTIMLEHED